MKQFIIICVLIFSFLECYSQAPEDTVLWEMKYERSDSWNVFQVNAAKSINKIDGMYFLPSYIKYKNQPIYGDRCFKMFLYEFDKTGDYLRLIPKDIVGKPVATVIYDDTIQLLISTSNPWVPGQSLITLNKEYKLLDTLNLDAYLIDTDESKRFFFNADNILSFIGFRAERHEQYINILGESGNVIDRFELLLDGESMPLGMYLDQFYILDQLNKDLAFNFKIEKFSPFTYDRSYSRRIVKYDKIYNYLSHKDFGVSAEYFKTDVLGPNANGEMLVIYDSDDKLKKSHQIKFEIINSDFEIISEAEYSYNNVKVPLEGLSYSVYLSQLLDDGSFIFYYEEKNDEEKDGILNHVEKFSRDCQKEWEFNNFIKDPKYDDDIMNIQILDNLLIIVERLKTKHTMTEEPLNESALVIRAYRLTTTSVHDSPIFDSSLLYPNPYGNGGRLSIKSDNPALPRNAEIYNLSGRLIATVYAISHSGTSYELNMPPLFAAGSYVLKLNFSGSFESYPFLVE